MDFNKEIFISRMHGANIKMHGANIKMHGANIKMPGANIKKIINVVY